MFCPVFETGCKDSYFFYSTKFFLKNFLKFFYMYFCYL